MRKTTYLASILFASVFALPAMAAERGGGAGARSGASGAAAAGGGMGIGSSVRQAALDARMNGQAVGPAVRSAARVNAQAAEYANANAISRVQNSTGRANANSVLGNGGTTAATAASPAAAMLSSRSGVSTRTGVSTGTNAGVTNRTTARAGSQGPTHASANAISHVQDSPGRANANSVLGSGATDSGTGDTGTGTSGAGDGGTSTSDMDGG